MDIKAIVFDLDGTLLRSDETISDRSVEILKRAHDAGIKLVICTGRSQTSAGYAIERLGFVSHIISHAGCVITDCRTGQEVYRRSLPREDAAWASEVAAKYEDELFIEAMSSGTSIVAEKNLAEAERKQVSMKYLELVKKDIIIPENLTDFIRYNDIVEIDKFFFYSFNEKTALELRRIFVDSGKFTVLMPFSSGVEILPLGVDKGVALRELAKILDIKEENIMVAGDSDNDKQMFLPDTFKVAIGNAIPSLKELADYVAPTNDEDGVAETILKYVLKEEE